MIKEIKIYDMDGTLVCSLHRYKTAECGTKIDLEHWLQHSTEEFISQDKLLPLATEYARDLDNPTVYVIIATARACNKNDANYAFIEKYLGKPDKFIYRQGEKDTRGGAELKIQAIKPLLNLKQFKNAIIHVFEDNLVYLGKMCYSLNAEGHFFPSKQGH